MAATQELTFPSIALRIPTEAAAYEFLEELRWHGKPVCPHCGSENDHYFLTPKNGTSRTTNRGTQSERRLWKCKDCRGQFSVLTNTVMHGTHIPVRTWVLVFFELCSNKNGLAAREVERKYGLSPKSAWFLLHRIREAMRREPASRLMTGTILADETYIGGLPKNKHQQGRPRPKSGRGIAGTPHHKTAVMSILNKDTGEVRSKVVATVTPEKLRSELLSQVNAAESELHTDGLAAYRKPGREDFKDHQWVDHTHHEYVRGEVTTNHVEGYFSQLKRSIDGTHHHISPEHLHRYLAEFDFRYSTCDVSDTERLHKLAGKVAGKRVSYRPIVECQ